MAEPTTGDPSTTDTTSSAPTTPSTPSTSSSSTTGPTSSSTTSSTTSSPTTSSSSSSSSSSRATSTEEESTTLPTPTESTTVREPDNPSTLTTESSVVVTDPATVTRFSTITSNRPGVSPTSIANDGKSNSFFDNKGAVAGVFSVVGLIALAILFAIFFTVIRRRRAKKFDREIEAAAREAAAAQPPAGFLDDDDAEDRYNRGYSNGSGGGVGAVGGYGGGGGGGGYGAYSDVSSHGTYNQPALSHHNTGSAGAPTAESYNMREIDSSATPSRHMSVGPGEVFDYAAASGGAAGAAGIGVARARSMKGANANYGQALQDGSTPYAAFSAPPMPSTSPGPNGNGVNRRNTGGYESSRGMDILEAAGMGAHLSGAGRQSGQFGGGVGGGGLERNKSLNSSVSQYSNNSGGSQGYSDYPPPMPTHQGGYNDYPAYPQGGRQQQAAIEEDDGDDAYGGYVVDEPTREPSATALGKQKARESMHRESLGGQMPNPFDAAGHLRHQQQQQQQGGYPETPDVSEGPRVLKVANE